MQMQHVCPIYLIIAYCWVFLHLLYCTKYLQSILETLDTTGH